MPKQKTHKGTKKRFRTSSKGKVKHKAAGNSHLASHKDQKRKRKMRRPRYVSDHLADKIREALGKNGY